MARLLPHWSAVAAFVLIPAAVGTVPCDSGGLGTSDLLVESSNRDKKGTNASFQNGNSSRMPEYKTNASCVSFRAEGRGF